MAKPKPKGKPDPVTRAPKPKKFNLKVPRLRSPHEDLIPSNEAAIDGARVPTIQVPTTEVPTTEVMRPLPEVPTRANRTRAPKIPTTQVPTSTVPTTEIPTDERAWLNYPPVLNWMLDEFLPSLDGNTQLVMLRLLRLTLGFRRRNCRVSIENLSRRTRLSEQTVRRVLRALREDGYIEIRLVLTGVVTARGQEVLLAEKALPPASVLDRVGATQVPTTQVPTTEASMKISERKRHEEAPSASATRRVASADSSLDTELGIDRRIVALTQLVATYKASHPAAGVGELRERIRRMVEHERWTDLDVDEILAAIGDGR